MDQSDVYGLSTMINRSADGFFAPKYPSKRQFTAHPTGLIARSGLLFIRSNGRRFRGCISPESLGPNPMVTDGDDDRGDATQLLHGATGGLTGHPLRAIKSRAIVRT